MRKRRVLLVLSVLFVLLASFDGGHEALATCQVYVYCVDCDPNQRCIYTTEDKDCICREYETGCASWSHCTHIL